MRYELPDLAGMDISDLKELQARMIAKAKVHSDAALRIEELILEVARRIESVAGNACSHCRRPPEPMGRGLGILVSYVRALPKVAEKTSQLPTETSHETKERKVYLLHGACSEAFFEDLAMRGRSDPS